MKESQQRMAENIEDSFFKKVFGTVKRHSWVYAPILIGIGVGFSNGWSEW